MATTFTGFWATAAGDFKVNASGLGGNNVMYSGVVHLTILTDDTVVTKVGNVEIACG